ncbi:TetR/AcrR family transcriptional regulator [Virgisporangium ochraceum]|uniref:TetR/AcrR family transcriptional regulator n=1 Tax=Virgisporangium ochraceum TaxID=65505 RepID=UPI001944223D|nr:TetR family transcriptional regulator [Virgisporangium ochraceum]
MAVRSGRRPGSPDTRQVILDAARDAFAEKGYDTSSVRAIATRAGVDPALIHHYFGTKEKLFLACMDAPVDPHAVIAVIVAAPRDRIGNQIVRVVLGVWESPAGTAAAALVRTSISGEWHARLLREFLTTQILRHLAAPLGLDAAEAPLRTNLVASQLVGLMYTRYILRLEPLASAPVEELVEIIGPNVQRYLTGDLDLTGTGAATADR